MTLNSRLNSCDCIFWDWNGTLLDDVSVCVEIINASLCRRNLPPVTLERYLEVFTFPVIRYYETLGFDFSQETFEAAGGEFIAAYSKKMFECSLHRGVQPVLAQLRAAGKKQFVLSALQEGALKKILSHFRLESFFSDIRGLQDHYAWGKVELGQELIASSQSDATRTVMIGDTLHDLETAQAIGIDCILIAGGHNSEQRLRASGAPVFRSLEELFSGTPA
jgi:phosphoglycolate phosphatase